VGTLMRQASKSPVGIALFLAEPPFPPGAIALPASRKLPEASVL
jgi:hypothetical protein